MAVLAVRQSVGVPPGHPQGRGGQAGRHQLHHRHLQWLNDRQVCGPSEAPAAAYTWTSTVGPCWHQQNHLFLCHLNCHLTQLMGEAEGKGPEPERCGGQPRQCWPRRLLQGTHQDVSPSLPEARSGRAGGSSSGPRLLASSVCKVWRRGPGHICSHTCSAVQPGGSRNSRLHHTTCPPSLFTSTDPRRCRLGKAAGCTAPRRDGGRSQAPTAWHCQPSG